MSRDLLRVNTGVQDPFLWNADHPIFEPRPWSTTNLFTIDHHRETTPSENTTAADTDAKFHFQKLSDGLIKTRLQFGLAMSSTSATYLRACDWIGKRIINRLELSYNGNSLTKLTGKQLYDDMMMHEEEEDHREAYGALEGGDWTQAERETAAGNQNGTGGTTTTYDVDLPFWFTKDLSYCLHVNALSHDPLLEIHFAKVVDVIQTDGTSPTYTLSGLKLINIYVNQTPEDRAHILTEALQREDGFLYMHLEHETQQKTVANTNDTTTTTEFTSIRGAVTDLRVTRIRDSNWKNTSYANEPGIYETITSIALTGSGHDILRTETGSILQNYLGKILFHPKMVLDNKIYSVPFCFEPSHPIDRTGSLNFGK